MSGKKFTSVEEIRAEKLRMKSLIDSDVHRLHASFTECFMPASNKWLSSPSKYMNYVGYAIVVYKTASTFRGVFKFLRKIF